MITEKGTVKVSSQVDMGTQKELNRASFILAIVYLVLGGVILVASIAISVVNDDDGLNPFFFVGIILITLGVVLLIVINGTNKAASKFNKVEEVEFFLDHMIVREYTDGEHTSTAKVYYKWVLRVKETKNYLFLYNTRATAIVVGKNNLPPQELSAVRNLVGKPAKAAKSGAPAGGQPYNGNMGGGAFGNVNGNVNGNGNVNVNGGAGNLGANGSTVTPPWETSPYSAGGQAPADPFSDLNTAISDGEAGSGGTDDSND